MSRRAMQIVWFKRDLRVADHAPLNKPRNKVAVCVSTSTSQNLSSLPNLTRPT